MSGRGTDSAVSGRAGTSSPITPGSPGVDRPTPAAETSKPPARPAPEYAPARERRLPYPLVLVLLTAVLLAAVVAGLAVGSVPLPPADVWGILTHSLFPGLVEPGWPATYAAIVLDVRLPRVLLGGVVGAGLAVVGTALQAWCVTHSPTRSSWGSPPAPRSARWW